MIHEENLYRDDQIILNVPLNVYNRPLTRYFTFTVNIFTYLFIVYLCVHVLRIVARLACVGSCFIQLTALITATKFGKIFPKNKTNPVPQPT